LMSDPAVLLLDEPSLGLSPLVCSELFQALSRIKELGVGVLLVEQNARQALAIAGRGYLLENGRIVGEGGAADLRDDPAVRRAYLGGARESGNGGASSGRRLANGHTNGHAEAAAPLPARGRPATNGYVGSPVRHYAEALDAPKGAGVALAAGP